MADNLNYTEPGSGSKISTDQLAGGEHAQYVKLMDGTANSSAVIPGDATAGLWVNLKQADSTLVAGYPISNIFFAEDAAHTDADRGIQALTVRQDTAAATSGTSGDYQPLITDGSGRLHVSLSRIEKAEDTGSSGGDFGLPILAVRNDTASALAGTTLDYVMLTTDNAGRLHVAPPRPATATVTSVNDTASSTQLLAANANRIGATIFNDSSEVLYVKLGTTASTTDFSNKIAVGGYWEIPSGYSGRIDGIWANDSSGAARITEIT